MAVTYVCNMCDQVELKCRCDRYCNICYNDFDVRLCEDGCLYCPECREICGFSVESLSRG